MKSYTSEMIEKARTAETVEELLALAKENGIEMTDEEAAAFFAQLNPKAGELSDDELDDVSGGGCGSDDTESGPTVYYDVFTDGIEVYCGQSACAYFNGNECKGYYRGVINFTSSTKWYCTCSKCGAVFNGSGDPRQKELYPVR